MLCFFSISASAVEVNCVENINLRAPLEGNVSDFNIDVYGAVETCEQSAFDTINGIAWYKISKMNAGSAEIETQMKKTDTFEQGKKYRAPIFVKPTDDNVWGNSITATIKELDSDVLEAKSASFMTPTGNGKADYKVIVCIFECTQKAIDKD